MSGSEIAAWVGVGVAALAIAVTVGVAIWQRQTKRLTYEAYAEFPLLAPRPIAGEVEITSAGQRLTLPHVLIVTLRSTGGAAIRPEDFYGPIEVKMRDATLITLRIESSAGLTPTSEMDGTSGFRIDPLLLNPGEGIVCYALVDGCPHGVSVQARIADTLLLDASRPSFSELLLARVSLDLFGFNIGLKAGPAAGQVPATGTIDPGKVDNR